MDSWVMGIWVMGKWGTSKWVNGSWVGHLVKIGWAVWILDLVGLFGC